jgi:hypothetical protein
MAPLHRTVPAGLLDRCTRRLAAALGLTLSLGLGGGSTAAYAAEAPYPPATTFKEIQVRTLDCGRENSASSCGQARRLADPLMDNPRLSTSCKDALWTVRQLAVVAPSNGPERRDPIDRASRDVGAFCRQPYQPPASTAVDKPGSKPFSLISPTNP